MWGMRELHTGAQRHLHEVRHLRVYVGLLITTAIGGQKEDQPGRNNGMSKPNYMEFSMTTESELITPVLVALNDTPKGYLPMGEIREFVRENVSLSADDLLPLANRNDSRIDQITRNLKSHKKTPGNPVCEGLMEDRPGGLAITVKGRKALKK